jgi:hypothetical protein
VSGAPGQRWFNSESFVRLRHAFYQFPFVFDAERLRAEIAAISEEAWRGHVQGYAGNAHLPLISTNGGMNDSVLPPMQPTPHLASSPYMLQVLAHFRTLHGRARLMRLEPGHGVPVHFDHNVYWRSHTRVHIPIVTHPDVRFECGDEAVHMAAGEAWTFDNWRLHRVVNETPVRRVYLTFDTFGSSAFWSMALPHPCEATLQHVPFTAADAPQLIYETFLDHPVMSPLELDRELRLLVESVSACRTNSRDAVNWTRAFASRLGRQWQMACHAVGPTEAGGPVFAQLLEQAMREAETAAPPDLAMDNGGLARHLLQSTFKAMIRTQTAADFPARTPVLDRPIFIVAAPRSGSTLLFESLAKSSALWTLGGEGHAHIEQISALHPQGRGNHSNRLTAEDATVEAAAQLRAHYIADLRNADGTPYAALAGAPDLVRFLEKTPKNALRIPFLKAVFPDARFIFLHREPRANISSIMEAWRSGGFVTYRGLSGWRGMPWSLLLIPGWRDLNGADLAEIAMRQWRDANETMLRDLSELPAADWCSLSYEALLADPEKALQRLCAFAEIPFDARLQKLARAPLQPSRYTLSAPELHKWRKNDAAIAPFLDAASSVAERLAALS